MDRDAEAPPVGDTWVRLTRDPLPVSVVGDWAVRPDCGGVVVFTGTVRDHAEGRSGVTALTYEAYEDQVEPRLLAVAEEARQRWPDIGRLAMLHRVGELALCEAAVVVAASAPHRDVAFEAARFLIDALKATAPIWKSERHGDGEGWGTGAQPVAEVAS